MTQFCIYASKFVWIVNVWSSIRRLTQVPENPDILKKKKKQRKCTFAWYSRNISTMGKCNSAENDSKNAIGLKLTSCESIGFLDRFVEGSPCSYLIVDTTTCTNNVGSSNDNIDLFTLNYRYIDTEFQEMDEN